MQKNLFPTYSSGLSLSNQILSQNSRLDGTLLDCRRLFETVGVDTTEELLGEFHAIESLNSLFPIRLNVSIGKTYIAWCVFYREALSLTWRMRRSLTVICRCCVNERVSECCRWRIFVNESCFVAVILFGTLELNNSFRFKTLYFVPRGSCTKFHGRGSRGNNPRSFSLFYASLLSRRRTRTKYSYRVPISQWPKITKSLSLHFSHAHQFQH